MVWGSFPLLIPAIDRMDLLWLTIFVEDLSHIPLISVGTHLVPYLTIALLAVTFCYLSLWIGPFWVLHSPSVASIDGFLVL